MNGPDPYSPRFLARVADLAIAALVAIVALATTAYIIIRLW